MLPRPTPASWEKDLAIPVPDVFGVTVLSGSCAWLTRVSHTMTIAKLRSVKIGIHRDSRLKDMALLFSVATLARVQKLFGKKLSQIVPSAYGV